MKERKKEGKNYYYPSLWSVSCGRLKKGGISGFTFACFTTNAQRYMPPVCSHELSNKVTCIDMIGGGGGVSGSAQAMDPANIEMSIFLNSGRTLSTGVSDMHASCTFSDQSVRQDLLADIFHSFHYQTIRVERIGN